MIINDTLQLDNYKKILNEFSMKEINNGKLESYEMFGALLINWFALLASVCQKLGMCQVFLLGSIRDVSSH